MGTTGPRKIDGLEEPKEHTRFTLAQLLDDSEYSRLMPPEDREWIDAPRVGREQI